MEQSEQQRKEVLEFLMQESQHPKAISKNPNSARKVKRVMARPDETTLLAPKAEDYDIEGFKQAMEFYNHQLRVKGHEKIAHRLNAFYPSFEGKKILVIGQNRHSFTRLLTEAFIPEGRWGEDFKLVDMPDALRGMNWQTDDYVAIFFDPDNVIPTGELFRFRELIKMLRIPMI